MPSSPPTTTTKDAARHTQSKASTFTPHSKLTPDAPAAAAAALLCLAQRWDTHDGRALAGQQCIHALKFLKPIV